MRKATSILPVIVIAQFCCTSLWFAGNSVIDDLVLELGLPISALGDLTSAVQFGFIIGTLIFALFTIADRFSPSKVFLISALLGALFNLAVIWEGNSLISLLSLRFLTGFFLAGIYPVGMKIAADYFKNGLGKSLGFLVGALVLGTAFPHLLKEVTSDLPWTLVLIITSILAVFGGILMVSLVPNGPYRKAGKEINLRAVFTVFQNRKFRSSAFGYFGHMWELYAFWAIVPIILNEYVLQHPDTVLNIPILSFLIIGIGSISCVISGYASQKIGANKTAIIALILSSSCCIAAPFLFMSEMENVFIGFLMLWGMVVIADSPMLSTLVAQNAPVQMKGTALTIVNCIGFSISIISIQLITTMVTYFDSNNIYLVLAIGPILGTIALIKKSKDKHLIT